MVNIKILRKICVCVAFFFFFSEKKQKSIDQS